MENLSEWQKIQYIIKIILDKILAALLITTLAPLLLMISLLIKIDSKGPVIFKQIRLGKNGRLFTIYKFRTMCDNAVNQGTGIFTSEHDPRITRVGRYLRKTSLDELPQLVNVLKGEMSFVGPRPPLENHPNKYSEYSEFQKLRFKIIPGITGYAQAFGRNSLTWHERIEMDVYYYKNFSLLLDIKIIIATLFTVVLSKGTYPSDNRTKNTNKISREI